MPNLLVMRLPDTNASRDVKNVQKSSYKPRSEHESKKEEQLNDAGSPNFLASWAVFPGYRTAPGTLAPDEAADLLRYGMEISLLLPVKPSRTVSRMLSIRAIMTPGPLPSVLDSGTVTRLLELEWDACG